MYFITTKRMLEVCFSAHPNIQYRTIILSEILARMSAEGPGSCCGSMLPAPVIFAAERF